MLQQHFIVLWSNAWLLTCFHNLLVAYNGVNVWGHMLIYTNWTEVDTNFYSYVDSQFIWAIKGWSRMLFLTASSVTFGCAHIHTQTSPCNNAHLTVNTVNKESISLRPEFNFNTAPSWTRSHTVEINQFLAKVNETYENTGVKSMKVFSWRCLSAILISQQRYSMPVC